MLNITRFTVEGLTQGCVTDQTSPRFSFALDSSQPGASLKRAVLRVGDWEAEADGQIAIAYGGPALKPFTAYTACLTAEDGAGETAQAQLTFETGRLDTPWTGQWISDPDYRFTEKKVSPRPMTFRKRVKTDRKIAAARIYATAMGIYELTVNGQKAGERYFAPGFTSYQTNLQYQTYDVTGMLTGDDVIQAVVAGGWAVGSFVFTRGNRNAADRQALLLELRLTYEDGATVTVKEAIDGEVKRTFTATPGTTYTFQVTGETFMKVLNGDHTLTITANDTKMDTVHKLLFKKEITAAMITLTEPVEADAKIAVCVLSVNGSIPADANFEVKVTNNGKDTTPTWEDCTNAVKTGANHVFTNNTQTNGWAFNFKVTVSRGASGQGGYINSVQGGFQ